MGGGGGQHNTTSNAYWIIFNHCSEILSIKFRIFTWDISLWQILAFDIVVFSLTYWIIELFRRQ